MPRTPTALCRYDMALRAIRDIPVGRFIEIGCGTGDFLIELGRAGWSGVGIDLSADAIQEAADSITQEQLLGIAVRQEDLLDVSGRFDAAFCFEVLEHISDDVEFMKRVRTLLGPTGIFVLSVPARMDRWSPTDDLAGHVRRYERDELIEKLSSAGFSDISVRSMAVPLANMLKPALDRRNHARMGEMGDRSLSERTIASGMHRPTRASGRTYRLLFNRFTLAPALLLQRVFARSDLGRNYLVSALAAQSSDS